VAWSLPKLDGGGTDEKGFGEYFRFGGFECSGNSCVSPDESALHQSVATL
jgi:hypothetical protein